MQFIKRIGVLLLSVLLLAGLMSGCGTEEPPDSSTSLVSADTTTADITTTTETTATTTTAPTSTEKKTTTSKVTTTTTTAPLYDSAKKNTKIGFGFYGVAPDGGWTTTFDDMIQSDWVNTFIVGVSEMEEALSKAKVHNSQIFVSVSGLWRHFGSGATKLIDRWQEEVDKIIKDAKDTGCWERLAGFYMDEPLLAGITHEELLKATKYMREASGGKRVFICFGVAGISPEDEFSPYASPPLTPEMSKYITDTAFDSYGDWSDAHSKKFENLTNKMLAMFGDRKDVRVWYVPPVMNSYGSSTEENNINFVNGVIELLKKQENPGGIMCYSWQVAMSETQQLGNIGLGDLIKDGVEKPWTKLYAHLQDVGADICSGKTIK